MLDELGLAARRAAIVPGKGRPFKKGQSGNPRGGAKDPNAYSDAIYGAKVNLYHIENILNKYVSVDIAQLEILLKDKSLPVLDAIVVRILAHGLKEGSYKHLDFILNRLIGRVPEKVIALNIDQSSSRVEAEKNNLLEVYFEQLRIVGGKESNKAN